MKNFNIENQITEYFKARTEVLAAYVFGSFAKGRQQKGSDIDLGILLRHNFVPNEDEFYRTYTADLTRMLRVDIHLVFMNNMNEGILSQIFKYGKCLVNNSPEGLKKFKMVSFSMIAEFSYLRNMMEKGFLRNLFGVNR